MQIRFVVYDEEYSNYKLLGLYNSDTFDVDFKLIQYMKENEISIGINTKDVIDEDVDEYYIDDVKFVAPVFGGDTLQHIEVYLKE